MVLANSAEDWLASCKNPCHIMPPIERSGFLNAGSTVTVNIVNRYNTYRFRGPKVRMQWVQEMRLRNAIESLLCSSDICHLLPACDS